MSDTVDVFQCPNPKCEETNVISYMSATRTDPGCYESDLECRYCGASLQDVEPDPWTQEDLRWAIEGD